nr:MAG TPA: hypothetical protein [Caudoviricetes sp.]
MQEYYDIAVKRVKDAQRNLNWIWRYSRPQKQ